MRAILFLAIISLPMLAAAQQAYTNCRTYGQYTNCEHGVKQRPGMGNIQTVNPNTYLPRPVAPNYQGNPVLNGMRQAEESELRQQQIEYYRNLNRQMR